MTLEEKRAYLAAKKAEEAAQATDHQGADGSIGEGSSISGRKRGRPKKAT